MSSIDVNDSSKKDVEPNVLAVVSTRAEGEVAIKTYKRRYFGLLEVALLNMITAWHWTHSAPVVGLVMERFDASIEAVTGFSTAFLFACFLGNCPAAIALRRGPKCSMVCCVTIVLAGAWLKYGGTKIGNFGLAMFGQVLCGFSQPFVLNLPVVYAEHW